MQKENQLNECSECESEIFPTDKFCSSCGNEIKSNNIQKTISKYTVSGVYT